jgi:glutathione S-transferase
MKLYLNKASPYARLVMVVIHEKRLADKVELVWTDPWASPPDLLSVNPLAKVPALVTDGGLSIIDSVCICTHLDDIGHGPRLLPAETAERIPALMKYGFGRGLIDVAFGVIIERRYANPDSKPLLAERWLTAVQRTIAALEKDPALMHAHEHPGIGDLAIAVGLAYVEFRLPEVRWRGDAPNLVNWFDRMSDRPAMRLTAPE